MKKFLLLSLFTVLVICANASDKLTGIRRLNPTAVEVLSADGSRMTIDFYGKNIFRMFQDLHGGEVRPPVATPPAEILVSQPRKAVGNLAVTETATELSVATEAVKVSFNRSTSLFSITDLTTGKVVASESKPIDYKRSKYTMYLKEQPSEFFYGGGVQNGRFSHKGEKIEIVNTNSWTDGGVASPAPFYWSTGGYAVMCHTFAPGLYDFGNGKAGEVSISHDINYLDIFFMVNKEGLDLMRDYYQLTGNPVLLPKFGFFEGHLNAYNRDYWKEDTTGTRGVLFEDGKRYIESQKDNGGIKESLNGEKGNYQFSARAVVDRYAAHDMPLGWVLPNDGYGAGYGQTETLDGNVENLRQFGECARQHGVEIGLWTQSDLHPVDGVSALLQRDIVKEVRDAGVRVLKTDVAWVGYGYSFGLNGIADVAQIMPYYGNNARPFIITLDGWAGTQRYGTVWSGDQTGGKWEYIRFHIPTYIGAGLSGLGNISSDMDGIFGGKDRDVNVRDFEWKTFTPMQLNMDGWGLNEKYPHALGEPATSINRSYLKWKSMLLPYSYSCSYQMVDDKPLMRPMFIDYPNEYTLGPATRYQFMYGPSFLIAPIYQATDADESGNDIRNGIYLPEGKWIDYFTGDTYEGGVLLNNFDAPLWKLPVFVCPGAIIPMNNPANNPGEIDRQRRVIEVYPSAQASEFSLYDDDGTTDAYRLGAFSTTLISQQFDAKNRLSVDVAPTQGEFDGMPEKVAHTFIVNLTSRPRKVNAVIGGKKVALREVMTEAEFINGTNVYYYNESPELNRFATEGSDFAKVQIIKNPQLWVNTQQQDVKSQSLTLTVEGCVFDKPANIASSHGALQVPASAAVLDADNTPYSLTPSWQKVEGADYYEIEYDGQIYSTIRNTSLAFGDLKPETSHTFKVRAVNADGKSDWATIEATTKDNPLEFAIQGLTADVEAGGTASEDHEVSRLFDFQTAGDIWFDYMPKDGSPFVLTIDLHCTTALDELHYLPREGGGNGTFIKARFEASADGKTFADYGTFTWATNDSTKVVRFADHPEARYVRVSVLESRGNYVSGREIFVFGVPGSKRLIPGDINQDGRIGDDDLTSYLNYTGLRRGDSDFEGYVSKGDLNGNGLIDAYDISEVATKLDGGIFADGSSVDGSVTVTADKAAYEAGDEVVITVRGEDLKAVNALSLAIPYVEANMQFVSVTPLAVKDMYNMTNDRLHKDGTKALYPTFVNIGDKETVSGSCDLMTIRFKALRKFQLKTVVAEGMLVDKFLNTKEFK